MSFLRPEALAALRRWREAGVALALAAAGAWLAARGGLFFGALGALVIAAAAGLGVTALRRLRFGTGGTAPGVVQVDEGAVAWFGPETGGVVALSELVRIEALMLDGLPAWRLTQEDGHALTLPAGARGAEALFDVFATLPGARAAAFPGAHAGLATEGGVRVLWRRDGGGPEPRLAAPTPPPRP